MAPFSVYVGRLQSSFQAPVIRLGSILRAEQPLFLSSRVNTLVEHALRDRVTEVCSVFGSARISRWPTLEAISAHNPCLGYRRHLILVVGIWALRIGKRLCPCREGVLLEDILRTTVVLLSTRAKVSRVDRRFLLGEGHIRFD
jgi:hypothetical protein